VHKILLQKNMLQQHCRCSMKACFLHWRHGWFRFIQTMINCWLGATENSIYQWLEKRSRRALLNFIYYSLSIGNFLFRVQVLQFQQDW